MHETSLPEGASRRFTLWESNVVIARVSKGRFMRFPASAHHMACPLSGGAPDDHTLICACHDWRYDIRTGRFLDARARSCRLSYQVPKKRANCSSGIDWRENAMKKSPCTRCPPAVVQEDEEVHSKRAPHPVRVHRFRPRRSGHAGQDHGVSSKAEGSTAFHSFGSAIRSSKAGSPPAMRAARHPEATANEPRARKRRCAHFFGKVVKPLGFQVHADAERPSFSSTRK